ncbi:hypothetical protein C8F01DRAFT_1373147 [Mycena amicta]|nr:hypothetical protein C8F01DRAFT_1373147 [Mycena amicta]
MDPEQNPPTQPPGSHRQYYVIDQAPLGSRDREEAGAAKLWSVYVDEAEKYDKSLVESWRSDMEGMLIFAGLFSASLTAFLVESYKTLVPDSGDATVHLLGQILAASQASNSSFTPSAPAPFRPAVTSLICNALWFVSLGLSLACALMATLLAQWARDFLHRANTRSSPVTRARMYSYLYYGLRRFRMHAVVDVIPSLLHASLGFFFAGLVAFLLPVNKIIAALVAGIMALVVGNTSLQCTLALCNPLASPVQMPIYTVALTINPCQYNPQCKKFFGRPEGAGHSGAEVDCGLII